MGIYSGMGDTGDTTGPSGQTVRKTHPAVGAMGGLDELSAHLGWALAAGGELGRELDRELADVQAVLLGLGAQIAFPRTSAPMRWHDQARALEGRIDSVSSGLPPLSQFLLARGSELSCRLHVARTVCRRAERMLVGALDAGVEVPEGALAYLNRLGDLLFVLARRANQVAGIGDIGWDGQPPRK